MLFFWRGGRGFFWRGGTKEKQIKLEHVSASCSVLVEDRDDLPSSFWFNECGWGGRICISNNSRDANITAQGPHLERHWLGTGKKVFQIKPGFGEHLSCPGAFFVRCSPEVQASYWVFFSLCFPGQVRCVLFAWGLESRCWLLSKGKKTQLCIFRECLLILLIPAVLPVGKLRS